MNRRQCLQLAAGAPVVASALPTEGREELRREYDQQFPGDIDTLDLDLINGTVTVRLGMGSAVRVQAKILYQADLREDLPLAEKEIRFEPRVEGKILRVWVEAPQNRRWNRYQFRHDVEVTAPAGKALLLHHVNGAVHIIDLRPGSQRLAVKHVNGPVDLEFGAPLSADLELDSMRGNVYSDFEVTERVKETEQVTEKGLRRIVSRKREIVGRIGSGGKQIRVSVVNGDIRLIQWKEGKR